MGKTPALGLQLTTQHAHLVLDQGDSAPADVRHTQLGHQVRMAFEKRRVRREVCGNCILGDGLRRAAANLCLLSGHSSIFPS
jgi:hypothetical protein